MRVLATVTVLLAALALGSSPASALPPPTTVVYVENFDGPAGPEWSRTERWTTSNAAPGRTLGGIWSNDQVHVDVGSAVALPSHTSVTVTFELYILASMDGSYAWGPDVIRFAVDGTNAMYATFLNDPWSWQSYPSDYPGADYPACTGSDECGVDYGHGTQWPHLSSMYTITRTVPHTSSALLLTFAGVGLQGWADEGWSLDSIVVEVEETHNTPTEPVPELATLALVGAGVVGVAAVAVRRRG